MNAESPAIRAPLALRLTVMIVVLVAAGALLAFKMRQWNAADASVAGSDTLAVRAVPQQRPAAATAARDAACGTENQPDCPLQRWMDQRINTFFTSRNVRELAAAFRFLSKIAPPDYPDWAAWADGGVAAAAKADFPLAKRACVGCHNDYRERYRADMRSRALPAEDTSSSARPGPRN